MSAKRSLIGQALTTAAVAALVLLPWFWIIGAVHFGVIVGDEPTGRMFLRFVLLSVPVAILFFGWLLRRNIERRTKFRLSLAAACVAAAGALAPMLAASAVVTLWQADGDALVVALGFVVGLTALCASTARLSKPATPAQSNSY